MTATDTRGKYLESTAAFRKVPRKAFWKVPGKRRESAGKYLQPLSWKVWKARVYKTRFPLSHFPLSAKRFADPSRDRRNIGMVAMGEPLEGVS
jgi:hypothetical protein